MSKRTLKSFFLAALTAVALGAPVNAQDGFWCDLFNSESDCIQFTASGEYLFMGRDVRLDNGTGIISGPDAGITSFENADFGLESGYRVSMGVETQQHRWEAIFAQYGDWVSRNNGSLTAGLQFEPSGNWPAGSNILNATTFFAPLNVAALADIEEDHGLGPGVAPVLTTPVPTYQSFYESSLQDLQVNLIDNDDCAEIRVGVGYRNLQLDEAAGITFAGTYIAPNTGAFPAALGLNNAELTGAGLTFIGGTADGFQDGASPGGPDQLTLDWLGSTNNQLNGFQVIFDACLIDNGRFDVTMVGKAGAYHNHATGRIRERYTGVGANTSVYGRDFSDSKDTVAFAGSVGMRATVALSANVRLIGGYEGMFMSGLALGPEQNGGVNGTTYEVDTDGSIIVHGANVGLELTY